MGVFQGSPLGPRVYLYHEVQYMTAARPGHTGIPSVWNNGVEFAFDTERYSDNAVVPAALEEALVAMPSQQDAVAPKFRVRHVPSKEDYLNITWTSRAGATRRESHTARRVQQGPATRQTPRHLGTRQPSPQRGGRDGAATEGPSGSGRIGDNDHPPRDNPGRSTGVHGAGAGASSGTHTWGATDGNRCVPAMGIVTQ